jgi:hypothetical protein
MVRRLALLILCAATGVLAFACLNYWSVKHAPLFRRVQWQWNDDIARLEASHKLPPSWNDVKEIKIIGGTPETKALLPRLEVPLKANPEGHFGMEILLVLWEESGKRGILIQYNIEDLKTKNTVAEIGRTLILDEHL